MEDVVSGEEASVQCGRSWGLVAGMGAFLQAKQGKAEDRLAPGRVAYVECQKSTLWSH